MIAPGGVNQGLDALFAFATFPVVLLMGATGLWLGCCLPASRDLAIGLLAGGFLGGGSGLCPALRELEAAPALLALVVGGLVALGRTNDLYLWSIIFLGSGFALGLSARQLGGSHIGLCGALAVMLPVAIGFYLSLLPDHSMWSIGRRVLGSWIFAVSLLVLAFSVKYGQAGALHAQAPGRIYGSF